ncbi:MAG: hypothetical protein ACLU0Y_06595 [Hominilimicola sp.]
MKKQRNLCLFITICLLMTFVPMQMAYADSAFMAETERRTIRISSQMQTTKQLATEVNGEIITAIHILKILKLLRKLLNFRQRTDMFR